MNRKILISTITLTIILGGYGIFYTAQSLYFMPQDLKIFKDESKFLEDEIIPESNIKDFESNANEIEHGPSLKILPPKERKKNADDLRNYPSYNSLNYTIFKSRYNLIINQVAAIRYDLTFRGNVGKDIRDVDSMQLISLSENLSESVDKLPTDIENGDNAVLAHDIREIAKLSRKLNAVKKQNKIQLQNITGNLGG